MSKPGSVKVVLSVVAMMATTAIGIPAQQAAPFTLADALRTTLLEHPQLRIQQEQVEVQRGLVRQTAGQFNTTLAGDATHGHSYRPLTGYEAFLYSQYDNFNVGSAATSNSYIAFGATRQLRNGIILEPSVTATRVTDNLTNRIGISQGSIQFAATLPLLRGRGRDIVTAQEQTSKLQLEAALFDLNGTISGLLATTANAYWNTVAAQRLVTVLRDADSRADTLVSSTQSLINADRLPRVDINTVKANKAQRTANRLEAEQRLIESRQQLALDMGLDVAEVEKLPEIATPFPAELSPEAISISPESLDEYVQLALDRKPELRALRKRSEASQTTVRASRNALRPQLDVRLATGVSGLDEGTRIDEYLLSPVHSASGANLSGGITYRFPVARDAAKGAMQQADALARQADLQVKDLARKTSAAVVPAVYGLKSEAEQVIRAHEAVAFYRNSVNAEGEKLRMGAGSVINSITIQDYLTAALQTEVQAELTYAQMIVRLRYATSTIIDANAKGGSIDPGVFSGPPDLPQGAQKPAVNVTTTKTGTTQ